MRWPFNSRGFLRELPNKKAILVSLVFLFIFPLLTPSRYYMTLLSEMFIWALFAASYDLVLGYTGLVSFGQAAFFGVGAYASALLLEAGMPFASAVIAATLFGALLGLAMGIFAKRVSGIYYALVTLAFAEVLLALFNKWVELSGGETGISVPRPSFLRSDQLLYPELAIIAVLVVALYTVVVVILVRRRETVRTRIAYVTLAVIFSAITVYFVPLRVSDILAAPLREKTTTMTVMNIYYFLTLIPLVVCYFVMKRIVDSPLGHIFVAIRENEERAEMLGYNVFRYRLLSSSISGIFAALAGALYAPFILSINPTNVLGAGVTINVLLYSILGGLGTLIGPMIGAGIITLLANQLPAIPYVGEYWMLVLGVFYLLVILFLPYGIVNTWRVKRGSARKRLKELARWVKTTTRKGTA